MTDNDVAELVNPWQIRLLRSGLIGGAVNRRFGPVFETRHGGYRFEFEAQIVRHFGEQDNWEFNVPVGVRLTPGRRVLGIDSIAFLVGPSLASEPPAVEVRRGRGRAERGLIYFHLEIERALRSVNNTRVFMRIHHRSGGYGAIAEGVGSNALVIGLRRDF